MFKENPHCHYCGVLTEMPEAGVGDQKHNPKCATIDHIYSKIDLRRWVGGKQNEERYVLACQSCNNGRQIKESEHIPSFEKWARGCGFKPTLRRLYPTLEEAYKDMRKIYERYGVPHNHLKAKLSS